MGEESIVGLKPVESTHLAGWSYNTNILTLKIQFRNADVWLYYPVPPEVIGEMERSTSIGAFFSRRIRGQYQQRCIHHGTLQERAALWVSSKASENYAGYWVALDEGSPVRVLGYGDTEEQARAATSDGPEVVVVKVEGGEE